MTPDYCLPILRNGREEVLELIRQHLDDYRYFEVWLDYVHGADQAFLKELADLLGERLIVTFRRRNLEAPRMAPETRRGLLGSLRNTSVMVDLDVVAQESDIKDAEGLRLLASYHNYEETPDTLQLEAILDTMKAYRPAVYKLSTLCRTAEDGLRLLQVLLKLKDGGSDVIVSGMGEHGAVTRIFGTLWGNKMVFAPLDEAGASAPGQLTRQQLQTIFKELGA